MPTGNFSQLINSETPVLIDFAAAWCGPCKMMPPILKSLKNTLGQQIKILTIDVDKNPQLAAQYKIQGVPTLMLFKNGTVVWRQSGVLQATQLQQVIQPYLN